MKGLTKNFTDTNVLMGAGLGVLGALAVSIYGAKFVKDDKIRMVLAALAPGLAASFISKNKTTVMTAAAAGLAVGLVPVIGKALTPKTTAPAATSSNTNMTAGLIDDRYTVVNGDIYADVSGIVDTPDFEAA